jgi:hypothetical protein
MTKVDHARLVQALQNTSNLIACNLGPDRHSMASQKLQSSIAMLLAELNNEWCELVPQNGPQPSVGIPD